MPLVSFQSPTPAGGAISVTGHLVRIVSRLQGAVHPAACSPDLHGPVAGRQEEETAFLSALQYDIGSSATASRGLTRRP